MLTHAHCFYLIQFPSSATLTLKELHIPLHFLGNPTKNSEKTG